MFGSESYPDVVSCSESYTDVGCLLVSPDLHMFAWGGARIMDEVSGMELLIRRKVSIMEPSPGTLCLLGSPNL